VVAITARQEPPMPQTATATQPSMCLKHGDFHIMDADCWDATVDWYFTHQDASRDAYLAAVERQMLDNHIRSL
jgi:hypothetical protein